MYTWKSQKGTCSSISLVTLIFRDTIEYERSNATVAVEKTTGLHRKKCGPVKEKL